MASASQITDRAKRYRAQKAVRGPKRCIICGKGGKLDVMHLDGDESHGGAENLAYGCRSCNGKLAAAFKRAGRGRLTNQYNPAKGEYPTLAQYAWAVGHHERGAHDEGGAVIHATPKELRSEYARAMAGYSQRTKRARAAAGTRNPASDWTVARFGSGSAEYQRAKLHHDRLAGEGVKVSRISKESTGRYSFKYRYPVAGEAESGSAGPLFDNPGNWRVEGVGGVKDSLGGAYLSRDKAAAAAKRIANQTGAVVSVFSPSGAEIEISPDKRKKRNPAGAAAEVFEDFHGFKPSEVVTVTKTLHHHENLAGLGTLVSLEVWGVDKIGHDLDGFRGAILASNENRNQLFIEGGDQTIDLRDYGIKAAHELETLGVVLKVAYKTNKTHLGAEGGKAVYVHDFTTTNENGRHVKVPTARLPQLLYDVRNEHLLFSGGSYEILREGIDK